MHVTQSQVVSGNKNQRQKSATPTAHQGGSRYHAYPGAVDLSEGNWLALATCSYMLNDIEEDLRYLGLPSTIYGKTPIKQDLLKAVSAWKRLNQCEQLNYN